MTDYRFRRATVWCLVSWIGLAGVGCGTGHLAHEPAEAQPPVESPAIRVATLEVQPRTWPVIVRAQGTLMADEVSTVGAKMAGRVAVVHVDLGDRLEAHAPLVTLDESEFRLQVEQVEAQLAQTRAAVGLQAGQPAEQLNPPQAPPAREAKAVWDEAVATTTRLRQLRETQAITEAQFDQAVSAEKVAEARYASSLNGVREKLAEIAVKGAELAVAQQRLQDAVTYAPFAGQVQARMVAPGAYVQVGQPLVSLVRTSTLRFRGAVPERYAHQIQLGKVVFLQVESQVQPLQVEITRVSPALDEASRSLVFEAAVENQTGSLRPGLFAEAEVVLDPNATALVVPDSAVVEFAGAEKVWKVVDGQAVEQAVQIGRRSDHEWEIRAGLQTGDVILVQGQEGRVARVDAVPHDATRQN